jgi:hypothetical protein
MTSTSLKHAINIHATRTCHHSQNANQRLGAERGWLNASVVRPYVERYIVPKSRPSLLSYLQYIWLKELWPAVLCECWSQALLKNRHSSMHSRYRRAYFQGIFGRGISFPPNTP